MEIYSTGKLKIRAVHVGSDAHLIINPNDGFDIGLMMTEAPVMIYTGSSPEDMELESISPVAGVVVQKNECCLGTLELSNRTTEMLGSPGEVRLHLIPGGPCPKLLISPD